MKVISGYLKGRNIKGYNVIGTRPTMNRVKESLFATIYDRIPNSLILDLFSGSGQLGIEAISNGGKYCYFIDNNKEIANILRQNIRNLNIENKTKVIENDFEVALNKLKKENVKFGLIFADPPYKSNLSKKVIDLVIENNLLEEDGLLILEYQEQFNDVNKLKLIKCKKYSDKFVNIYQK